MKVFVSYTSKDPAVTKVKLEQLEKKITPFAKVFIDLLHNESGKQRRVDRELHRCDVVLQIVSPQYKSEWVQNELISARKNGKTVIKVGMDELIGMDEEELFLLLSDVEKKGWSVWTILCIALLVCVGVSILGIWLSYLFVSGQDLKGLEGGLLTARGVFGDSWGGVNAIISAFAFAGVIVTLFLQNRDLNLQRKEMARQREEFEKENETLKYQRFENTFYNMLNLQQQIVDGLRYDYYDNERTTVHVKGGFTTDRKLIKREVVGRDVFRYLFSDVLLVEYNSSFYGYKQYLQFCGIVKYDGTLIPTYFDHYFRHLYKIVQFVDSQEFSFGEKYRYLSFLRGTLSRYELVWLYYNALHPDFYKFKRLIEKYSLLKALRSDLLSISKETVDYYKGLGVSDEDLKDNEFGIDDFAYFLTDNPNEESKYMISAFWNSNDYQNGVEYLKRWNVFVSKAAEKVVKEE